MCKHTGLMHAVFLVGAALCEVCSQQATDLQVVILNDFNACVSIQTFAFASRACAGVCDGGWPAVYCVIIRDVGLGYGGCQLGESEQPDAIHDLKDAASCLVWCVRVCAMCVCVLCVSVCVLCV